MYISNNNDLLIENLKMMNLISKKDALSNIISIRIFFNNSKNKKCKAYYSFLILWINMIYKSLLLGIFICICLSK